MWDANFLTLSLVDRRNGKTIAVSRINIRDYLKRKVRDKEASPIGNIKGRFFVTKERNGIEENLGSLEIFIHCKFSDYNTNNDIKEINQATSSSLPEGGSYQDNNINRNQDYQHLNSKNHETSQLINQAIKILEESAEQSCLASCTDESIQYEEFNIPERCNKKLPLEIELELMKMESSFLSVKEIKKKEEVKLIENKKSFRIHLEIMQASFKDKKLLKILGDTICYLKTTIINESRPSQIYIEDK